MLSTLFIRNDSHLCNLYTKASSEMPQSLQATMQAAFCSTLTYSSNPHYLWYFAHYKVTQALHISFFEGFGVGVNTFTQLFNPRSVSRHAHEVRPFGPEECSAMYAVCRYP